MLTAIRQPILGVIVCISPGKTERPLIDENEETPSTEFFMKQPKNMGQSCSIIACLQVVMNNLHFVSLEEGSVLDMMRVCLTGKESSTPEKFMANCDKAKKIHKETEKKNETESKHSVDHHFVSYVINSRNQLCEMNGAWKAPRLICNNCSQEQILEKVCADLKIRLENKEIG